MKVWLYYRLSRDEDDELNSLTNQRKIIYEYAVTNGHEVVGESFDDNVSGMHFNREGIDKIYEVVEAGKIEAIIVKDLSRLGRHRTQTALFIDYLREHYPAARRLFLLGTPSMVSEFEAAGYVPTADSADDVPDAVVAAFDMTLEYSRLCRAAWWAKQGLPYIATNPDRVCPTDLPTVLVDCGSICAAIEHATGRRPDVTLGKPDPNMLSGILARHGLRPEQIAMVGDRIYTDVEMARNAGALGVLVLSGETTLDVAEAAEHRPDLIAEHIGTLGELLREARRA